MIPLFKYELAFILAGGEGGVAIEQIEADYYEDDDIGPIATVTFVRDVPDPEAENPGETIGMKVFEVPADRVVYVRNLGELPDPDAVAQLPAEEAAFRDEAAAHTTGEPLVKDLPPHGGYPDPQNPGDSI